MNKLLILWDISVEVTDLQSLYWEERVVREEEFPEQLSLLPMLMEAKPLLFGNKLPLIHRARWPGLLIVLSA